MKTGHLERQHAWEDVAHGRAAAENRRQEALANLTTRANGLVRTNCGRMSVNSHRNTTGHPGNRAECLGEVVPKLELVPNWMHRTPFTQGNSLPAPYTGLGGAIWCGASSPYGLNNTENETSAKLRIMEQTNSMLACKLQQAQIVRAEVHADARIKAEQLKGLNEERFALMAAIEDEAGARAMLQTEARRRGAAMASVEKNILLMRLHDEKTMKGQLASELQKQDNRMDSLLQLNTDLVSQHHIQGALASQLRGDTTAKQRHLSAMDQEVQTMTGMVKTSENARLQQQRDDLARDQELYRLAQRNCETAHALVEKDRMLKMQGEQLRLMRDRSLQVHSRHFMAGLQLQEQGAQLHVLSQRHTQLTCKLAQDEKLFVT